MGRSVDMCVEKQKNVCILIILAARGGDFEMSENGITLEEEQ